MLKYSITIMSTKPGTPKLNIKNTKAYGVLQLDEVLDTYQLAEHIANHGSVYSAADVFGITNLISTCVRELLLEGKKVQIGALGYVYPTVSSEGANSIDSFSATNIKEVNVRFVPGKAFRNLRRDANFKLVLKRSDAAQILTDQKAGS